MTSRTRVSVVLSTHNDGRYVQEAVDSILAQSFADFEFIAIDDGSDDGTGTILDECAARDSRLRVLHNETNLRWTRSWNIGVESSRGEFIARMDGDDVAFPERFERQLDYMDAHPECVALGTQMELIDPDGDPLGKTCQPLDHEGIELELWRGHGAAMIHPTVMMRKIAIEAIGGYREKASRNDDLDLFLRLGERGRLANMPDVLGKFRRHPQSMTGISGNMREESILADLIRELRVSRGLDPNGVPLQILPHPASEAEWHARWAIRAFRNGHRETGRKHAMIAMRQDARLRLSWVAVVLTFCGERVVAALRGGVRLCSPPFTARRVLGRADRE